MAALLVIPLVIAWGAFAFGAVYWWGYLPIAVAALLLCVYEGVSRRSRRRAVTAVGIAACGVVAAAIVQLVPFAQSAIAQISPATHRFLLDFDPAYGVTAAARHPLSVAPRQTMLAIGALVVGMAWIASLRHTISTRLSALVRAIAVIGATLAMVGLVQKATFNGKLLWFWTPEFFADNGFGPFVNRNHFAGWMTLALALTAGYFVALIERESRTTKPGVRNRLLWLGAPQTQPILLLAIALVVMAVSIVWTMSRSGVAASAVSMAVLLVAVAVRTPTWRRRAAVVCYLAVVVLGALMWKGSDTMTGWYMNTGTLEWRVQLWRDSWALVRDFWTTGAGLNGYSALMLVYPRTDMTLQPYEAHNDYLQLAIEGGALVGIPVLVLVGAVVHRIVRGLRRPQDEMTWWIRMGATAGLCGIAVQEVAEFSLQIVGVALLFATCLAIALHQPEAGDILRRREKAREQPSPVPTKPRLRLVPHAAALALAASLMLVLAGCAAPVAGERPRAEYDSATGRLQRIAFDANKNGRNDSVSVMDGARVLRVELDLDENGKVERWDFYTPERTLEKVGFSRMNDGVMDAVAYYQPSGAVARIEISTHRNDRFDRVEFYEQGALVRSEEDRNGDGRADKWETYRPNPRPGESPYVVESAAFDDAGHGTVTSRITYRQ